MVTKVVITILCEVVPMGVLHIRKFDFKCFDSGFPRNWDFSSEIDSGQTILEGRIALCIKVAISPKRLELETWDWSHWTRNWIYFIFMSVWNLKKKIDFALKGVPKPITWNLKQVMFGKKVRFFLFKCHPCEQHSSWPPSHYPSLLKGSEAW